MIAISGVHRVVMCQSCGKGVQRATMLDGVPLWGIGTPCTQCGNRKINSDSKVMVLTCEGCGGEASRVLKAPEGGLLMICDNCWAAAREGVAE